MKVEIKDISQCNKEMTIIVPADRAKKDYYDIVKKFKSLVIVPGFRKGKAPVHLVENAYGDHAKEEFFNQKIQDYYKEALEKEEVNPVNMGIPKDVDWEKGKELKAVFSFEVMPEIKIEKYQDLEIPFEPIEFETKMIDETIEDYQKQMANKIDAETAEKGDEITAKINFPAENDETTNHVQRTFILGENSYCDEFDENITGAKVGDEIKTILFKKEPEQKDDELGENLVGKEFTVEIISIKRFDLPTINDEFAKDLEYENLETLRNEIEKQIKVNIKKQNTNAKNQAIFSKLIEENPFEVPNSMVERYAMETAQSYAKQYNIEAEKIAHLYKEMSEYDLKRHYITQELIKKLELKVEDEDKEVIIKEAAQNLNMEIDEYKKMYKSQIESDGFEMATKEKKLVEYLEKNNKFVKKEKEADKEK